MVDYLFLVFCGSFILVGFVKSTLSADNASEFVALLI